MNNVNTACNGQAVVVEKIPLGKLTGVVLLKRSDEGTGDREHPEIRLFRQMIEGDKSLILVEFLLV